MHVRVDYQGWVTHVLGHSPSSLFGFDPTTLTGKHLADFVDVLRPPGGY
jgi:hypothetical protein